MALSGWNKSFASENNIFSKLVESLNSSYGSSCDESSKRETKPSFFSSQVSSFNSNIINNVEWKKKKGDTKLSPSISPVKHQIDNERRSLQDKSNIHTNLLELDKDVEKVRKKKKLKYNELSISPKIPIYNQIKDLIKNDRNNSPDRNKANNILEELSDVEGALKKKKKSKHVHLSTSPVSLYNETGMRFKKERSTSQDRSSINSPQKLTDEVILYKKKKKQKTDFSVTDKIKKNLEEETSFSQGRGNTPNESEELSDDMKIHKKKKKSKHDKLITSSADDIKETFKKEKSSSVERNGIPNESQKLPIDIEIYKKKKKYRQLPTSPPVTPDNHTENISGKERSNSKDRTNICSASQELSSDREMHSKRKKSNPANPIKSISEKRRDSSQDRTSPPIKSHALANDLETHGKKKKSKPGRSPTSSLLSYFIKRERGSSHERKSTSSASSSPDVPKKKKKRRHDSQLAVSSTPFEINSGKNSVQNRDETLDISGIEETPKKKRKYKHENPEQNSEIDNDSSVNREVAAAKEIDNGIREIGFKYNKDKQNLEKNTKETDSSPVLNGKANRKYSFTELFTQSPKQKLEKKREKRRIDGEDLLRNKLEQDNNVELNSNKETDEGRDDIKAMQKNHGIHNISLEKDNSKSCIKEEEAQGTPNGLGADKSTSLRGGILDSSDSDSTILSDTNDKDDSNLVDDPLETDIDVLLERSMEKEKNRLQSYLVRLRYLFIVVDWEIPEAHMFEKSITSCPKRDLKKRIETCGIEIKKGPYSLKEDKIIKQNWEEFSQMYDFPDPKIFFTFKHDKTVTLPLGERIKFAQFLGKGLNNRLLFSIYQRFRTIFDNVNKGRFNNFEDKIILAFMRSSLANDSERFSKLAKMLNRDRVAILKHSEMLLKHETGIVRWDLDNMEKLLKSLLNHTMVSKVKELKHLKISGSVWEAVSKELNVSKKKLRYVWISKLYPKLFTKMTIDPHIVAQAITDHLFENRIKDWKLIDWDYYTSLFPGLTSTWINKYYRDFVRIHIPNRNRLNMKEIIIFLRKLLHDDEFGIKYGYKKHKLRPLTKVKFVDGKLYEVDINGSLKQECDKDV